jgi:histidinol dehydrogenase
MSLGLRTYTWRELSRDERRRVLERPAVSDGQRVTDAVRNIIGRVRRDGDAAIRELTAEFDGARIDAIEVSQAEYAEARNALPAAARGAIEAAIDNIRRFHEAQRQAPIDIETMPGVRCQRLPRAIQSVGLYVPAGSAPLPSAAMMLAVPAAIAGCKTRVLCSPPRPDGSVDPGVLYAASVAGVTRVMKIGGAQAIAAMAYGSETVPKAYKVFGPGNAWVTAAKALVAADPAGAAQDMPAGPSEVLVIADGDADPAFVASDLLSQAEHGPDSQVVLLTPDTGLLDAVRREVESQTRELNRRDIVAGALTNSALILVDSLDEAIDLSNDYAPEHLILQCADARRWLDSIINAGSVFLGPLTPESLGDYCSGTNHVLPTYGYARNYSGLGIDQFMRQMTVQEVSVEGLRRVGPIARELADLEGLTAHRHAVDLRLHKVGEST